eukprot:51363_1
MGNKQSNKKKRNNATKHTHFQPYGSQPKKQHNSMGLSTNKKTLNALKSIKKMNRKMRRQDLTNFREDDAILIFAWVHDFEKYFDSSFFVPNEVIELIVEYFSWVDSWDIAYSTHFNINPNEKTIQRIDTYNCKTYSAFGTHITSANDILNTKRVWNLKITGKGSNRNELETIIGIIDIDNITDDIKEKLGQDFTSFGGYAMNTRNGRKLDGGKFRYGAEYGRKCKETDVICMEFNVCDEKCYNNGTLKFYINGVDQGYAFTGIPNDKSYALAISMCQPDIVKLF